MSVTGVLTRPLRIVMRGGPRRTTELSEDLRMSPLQTTLHALPNRANPIRATRRRAFSITELLVVIGIIVLLIGILLPALNAAQQRGRQSETTATMTSFAQACETYYAQFGEYPGVVPERVLANDPQISGTENALLALMGGYARAEDFQNPADFNAFGGTLITFNGPDGNYAIRVNAAEIGNGPIVGGKPYPPFFSPRPSSFLPAPGQFLTSATADDPFTNDPLRLPDLLDGWGTPIIYMRAMRTTGPLVGSTGGLYQFDRRTMNPYLSSAALGERAGNQNDSIISPGFSSADVLNATVAQAIRHPAFQAPNAPLQGTARGAFVLISAGRDAVFFSRSDGPGTRANPITSGSIQNQIINPGPVVFEEFNDIRIFGGG